MGVGIRMMCEDCGEDYDVLTGSGIFFPAIYEERLEACKNGAYGEALKAALFSENGTAVDAELHIYQCPKCRAWKVEEGMSVYAPKEPMGPTEDDQWVGEPFIYGSQLSKGFHCIRKHQHKCDHCGAIMRKVPESKADTLPCPKCGSNHVKADDVAILWD